MATHCLKSCGFFDSITSDNVSDVESCHCTRIWDIQS